MDRDRLRRLLRVGAPDDASVLYRSVTAGCVVVSVLAAVLQDAVSRSTGYVAVVLVPIGFLYAFAHRGKRNVVLKILLTFGLLLAFAGFISGVRGATNIDDTRAPLVAVFLWTQVLHSFDVPRARDLTFSVASSVALIALAGSLAFSTSFLTFVLVYAVFLIAALTLGYLTELRRADDDVAPSREIPSTGVATIARTRRSVAARLVAGTLVTLLVTGVIFVFLPRVPAQQLASLPFSIPGTSQISGFTGDVSVPEGASSETGSPDAFDPDNYFGYGEELSLRVRGRLSEELVMRVRSPRPSLYRGQAYDVYSADGRWTSSDDDLQELTSGGSGSINIPWSAREFGPTEELVQTFYVERDLPNIVFHAYRPREIYVSDTRVQVDDFSSIRLPFLLEKDTIYSVISEVPIRDMDALDFAPTPDPNNPNIARFLQLPDSLQGRFRDLALEITAPHGSPADKAEAVQTWIKENKQYRLDISRDPPGRDPVDFFVFERDEGFCEQIAATMALMLRAAGVPTRVVTGFGPGQRNLFTGYWEVRNSDAHAWVEVFYPGYGWIPYDPTFGVPVANAANTTFMLQPLTKITSAVPKVIAAIGRAVSQAIAALPGPSWLVLPVLVAIAVLAFRRFGRRPARRGPPSTSAERAAMRWLEFEAALSARGYVRPPHETALEFAERLSPLRGQLGTDIRDLAVRFGGFRYGDMATDLEGTTLEAWEEEVTEATRAIRGRQRAGAR